MPPASPAVFRRGRHRFGAWTLALLLWADTGPGGLVWGQVRQVGAGVTPARAAESRANLPLESAFTVRSWEAEDGLPENTIPAMTQTPDGYLWLATFNGLVRFDGRRMTVFDPVNTPEMPSSRIHRLAVDRRGRLWTLSEFGDVCWYQAGRFHLARPGVDLGDERILTLMEDREGKVWGNIGLREARPWVTLEASPKAQPEEPRVLCSRNRTVIDTDGWIWDNSLVYERLAVWEPDRMRQIEVVPGEPEAMVNGLCASPRGGVWVTAGTKAYRFVRGQAVEIRTLAAAPSAVGVMLEDREGTLWVGGWSSGLFRTPAAGEATSFRVAPSVTQPAVREIFEDQEKNLWVGLDSRGLRRLRPKTVQVHGSQSAGKEGAIRSVTEDSAGHVWLATLDFVERLPGSDPNPALMAPQPFRLPWVLLGDPTDGVWAGTYLGGVARISETGVREDYLIPGAHADPYVTSALLRDSSGNFWVGTGRGLFRVVNGEFLREPIPHPERHKVRALAEGPGGVLYAGLHSGGLWRRDPAGAWKKLGRADGLPDENVTTLYHDDHGGLWIGTAGGGLACLRNGVLRDFARGPQGLPRAITAILEDNDHFLWLGSSRGIYRVARQALEELHAGRAVEAGVFHYDRADGMESSECTGGRQPSAIKTRDGRLWFSTVRGVAMIDPTRLEQNPVPPPVHIEEARLDDRPMALDGALIIPPGGSRLEIRYTGLSYSAPEKNRFRYRLEGWDPGWVEAGAERVAYYTRVSPGEYQFRVQACNNDGIWNRAGATLAVVVHPAWWQTYWFQGGVVILAAAGLLVMHRFRVRFLEQAKVAQEEFSRRLLNSQEAERKRIAGELHDSLGQNLLIIKNRAVLGLQKSRTPAEAAAQFEDISTAASRAVQEVRELAHNLRPYQLDELGLSKGIQATVGRMLRAAGIEFTHQVDRIDGLLPPEFEINLFRIVQETINNIVKHADATRVEVRLQRTPGRILLTLTDNGRGFDPQQTGQAFGLSGLAERARIMHGKCEIRSQDGAGTTVYVEIPFAGPTASSPEPLLDEFQDDPVDRR